MVGSDFLLLRICTGRYTAPSAFHSTVYTPSHAWTSPIRTPHHWTPRSFCTSRSLFTSHAAFSPRTTRYFLWTTRTRSFFLRSHVGLPDSLHFACSCLFCLDTRSTGRLGHIQFLDTRCHFLHTPTSFYTPDDHVHCIFLHTHLLFFACLLPLPLLDTTFPSGHSCHTVHVLQLVPFTDFVLPLALFPRYCAHWISPLVPHFARLVSFARLPADRLCLWFLLHHSDILTRVCTGSPFSDTPLPRLVCPHCTRVCPRHTRTVHDTDSL